MTTGREKAVTLQEKAQQTKESRVGGDLLEGLSIDPPPTRDWTIQHHQHVSTVQVLLKNCKL